jgi:hypothetical protein
LTASAFAVGIAGGRFIATKAPATIRALASFWRIVFMEFSFKEQDFDYRVKVYTCQSSFGQ